MPITTTRKANNTCLSRLIYSTFFGGTVMMTPQDFQKVNGFSNEFFGWGYEDDDFIVRHVYPVSTYLQQLS